MFKLSLIILLGRAICLWSINYLLTYLLTYLYVAPIGRLIESFGVAYHKYADDAQLYTVLTAKLDICISLLESCSSALQQWFWENDLLLNPDKSEVCFFGTRHKLQHAIRPSSIRVAGCGVDVCERHAIRPSSIRVAGYGVDVCEKLKTLGVSLDSDCRSRTTLTGSYVRATISSELFAISDVT